MKYCIIILFLGPIIAQDIDLLFEYGNQLFINGRFDDAIDKYENSDSESLMSVCEVINHPSDCIYIN